MFISSYWKISDLGSSSPVSHIYSANEHILLRKLIIKESIQLNKYLFNSFYISSPVCESKSLEIS